MRIKDREHDFVFGSLSRMPFRECEQGSITNIKGSFADVQGEQDLIFVSHSRMSFWECEQGSFANIKGSFADVQGIQDNCLENFRQVLFFPGMRTKDREGRTRTLC